MVVVDSLAHQRWVSFYVDLERAGFYVDLERAGFYVDLERAGFYVERAGLGLLRPRCVGPAPAPPDRLTAKTAHSARGGATPKLNLDDHQDVAEHARAPRGTCRPSLLNFVRLVAHKYRRVGIDIYRAKIVFVIPEIYAEGFSWLGTSQAGRVGLCLRFRLWASRKPSRRFPFHPRRLL